MLQKCWNGPLGAVVIKTLTIKTLMTKMDDGVTRSGVSYLTSLPVEIRRLIYAYLLDDWRLHVSCTRPPPPPPPPPEAECGKYAVEQKPQLAVRAGGFPTAVFLVCRNVYHDMVALKPYPLGTLQVEGDGSVVSSLRARFEGLLDGLREEVDWSRTENVLVNQDGVFALDVGVIKGRMNRLQSIEVALRDLSVNAQCTPRWLWNTLGQSRDVVRSRHGDTGWESAEFAFGYLHSFLGWQWPGSEEPIPSRSVELRARQHVSISTKEKCIARLVCGSTRCG